MIRASPQVADWLKILDKQSKIILLAIIEALESRKGKKLLFHDTFCHISKKNLRL